MNEPKPDPTREHAFCHRCGQRYMIPRAGDKGLCVPCEPRPVPSR
jgi:hypothetical protein